jgi:hypothetical protein
MAAIRKVLRIAIDAAWRHDDRLQLYTDSGTGTIDTERPLLSRPLRMFPGALPARTSGDHPSGMVPSGADIPAYPHLGGQDEWPAGSIPSGTAVPYIEVPVYVDQGFGTWLFSAEIVDGAGNVQSDPMVEFTHVVSGEEPPALSAFAFASYDAPTDRATFSFTV